MRLNASRCKNNELLWIVFCCFLISKQKAEDFRGTTSIVQTCNLCARHFWNILISPFISPISSWRHLQSATYLFAMFSCYLIRRCTRLLWKTAKISFHQYFTFAILWEFNFVFQTSFYAAILSRSDTFIEFFVNFLDFFVHVGKKLFGKPK